MMDGSRLAKIQGMARRMRRNVIELAFKAGPNGAHLGSALSIIEVTATLYGGIMRLDPRNPGWPDRDRFILSKGHGSLGLYTALSEVGFITRDQLFSFEVDGGDLPGQPSMKQAFGIEFSSGSLGLGLSLGIGSALAGRKKGREYGVFVLMGDGEMNEGSVWEAAMAASHYRLGGIVVIIDRNGMQSDGRSASIMSIDLESMWKGFGWQTAIVNGHDLESIYYVLEKAGRQGEGTPLAIIAKTVKGKGIGFMENNNEWHHNVLTKARYDAAVAELEAAEKNP
jgi:transketolase